MVLFKAELLEGNGHRIFLVLLPINVVLVCISTALQLMTETIIDLLLYKTIAI